MEKEENTQMMLNDVEKVDKDKNKKVKSTDDKKNSKIM